MWWPGWQTALTQVTLTLGLLLTAALLAGVLGQFLRLPKVTSYLLMGVLLGPSILDWIPESHVQQIEPLTNLAIALVLFTLGCHFPLGRLRRILRRVLRLSAGELGVTFLLVGTGLLALGAGWGAALLLAALALATAPATTVLVLKEGESDGPVTEYANSLVAINNLVSIVLFELLFIAAVFAHGQLQDSLPSEVGHLVHDLAGSVALGIVAGLVVSFCYPLVAESRRLALLVGVVTLVLGICMAADVPYLLTFLAMGVTVANSSDQTRVLLAELDRLTGLLCVVFFVTHGAELRVDKLRELGTIGAGYLVLRTCGKYFGVRLAAGASREEPAVRTWLGAALMAQAGAAIALASLAVHRAEILGNRALSELCLHVQTVILGTVVVFEIFGPILIRQAVLRSGEMPLAHAIHHPGTSPLEQLRHVCNRLLLAAGLDPWARRSAEDLSIHQIMRKNVKAVPQDATFDEIIAYIEHSRDNTFPVVDRAGSLVGLIRYRQLSHALFDRTLGPLVRTEDVTVPADRVLYPDEPVSRASGLFAASKDDCIPVVTRESPQRFLGMVRRRDVLRLLVRDRGGPEGA